MIQCFLVKKIPYLKKLNLHYLIGYILKNNYPIVYFYKRLPKVQYKTFNILKLYKSMTQRNCTVLSNFITPNKFKI